MNVSLAIQVDVVAQGDGSSVEDAFARLTSLLLLVDALERNFGGVIDELSEGRHPGNIIKTGPFRPGIRLDAPLAGYVGRPIRIAGTLDLGGRDESSKFMYRVLIDATEVDRFEAGVEFIRDLVLPPGVASGLHRFRLDLPAQGNLEPVNDEQTLEVRRAAVDVGVQVGRFSLLQTEIPIQGSAHSEFGPLDGAKVAVSVAQSVVEVETDSSGEFAALVRLPIWRLFVPGPVQVTIEVAPEQPWDAQALEQSSVFLINVTNASMAFLAVAMVGIPFVRSRNHGRFRQRGTAAFRIADAALPSPATGGPVGRTPRAPRALDRPGLAPFGTSDARQRVAGAYLEAADHLGRGRGEGLRRSQTAREFLRDLDPQAGPTFGELTILAERCLYAEREPEEQDVQRAIALARGVVAGGGEA